MNVNIRNVSKWRRDWNVSCVTDTEMTSPALLTSLFILHWVCSVICRHRYLYICDKLLHEYKTYLISDPWPCNEIMEQCTVHWTCLCNKVFVRLALHMWTWGWYSVDLWVGVCRWDAETLTLFWTMISLILQSYLDWQFSMQKLYCHSSSTYMYAN